MSLPINLKTEEELQLLGVTLFLTNIAITILLSFVSLFAVFDADIKISDVRTNQIVRSCISTTKSCLCNIDESRHSTQARLFQTFYYRCRFRSFLGLTSNTTMSLIVKKVLYLLCHTKSTKQLLRTIFT